MRTFDVFSHPEKDDEAVKKGFSFPGFFFGAIWAFVQGLPGIGLLYILILIALWLPNAIAHSDGILWLIIVVNLLYIALPLVVGFNGNNWRRSKLTRKGYTLKKTVDAANPASAIGAVPFMQSVKWWFH
jgi:hypothetical protein